MSRDPRSLYAERWEARRAVVAQLERRHRTIGNVRLLVFLTAALLAWLAWAHGALSPFWLAAPAAAFAALVVVHERTMRARRAGQRAVVHYERALARMDGRWAGQGET